MEVHVLYDNRAAQTKEVLMQRSGKVVSRMLARYLEEVNARTAPPEVVAEKYAILCHMPGSSFQYHSDSLHSLEDRAGGITAA
jgi:hypothetical protein